MLELVENEYAMALFVLVVSFLIAEFSRILLHKYIRYLAKRAKTDADDIILAMITHPLQLFILVTGLYIALASFSTLTKSLSLIEQSYFVFTVILVSYCASRLLSAFVIRWMKVQKRFEKAPKLITKIISFTIYLLALLIVLGYFKIDVTPFIATLGIGGLAISLALQSTLSNFFAGLHLISDRPINVGDYIELEGFGGYVEDIGWRSTRIKTVIGSNPNTIIIIPNSKLSESNINNLSLPSKDIPVTVECGVAYGSDLKKVERVTLEGAKHIQKTIPGAVKKFEPYIRFHTFGDSNILFTVVLRAVDVVDKGLLVHEFIKEVKERYDKEKIEISWPVRKIIT